MTNLPGPKSLPPICEKGKPKSLKEAQLPSSKRSPGACLHSAARAIAAALVLCGGLYSAAADAPRVLNGIDVLRRQQFAPLAGKRVGLITNHTGLAADGAMTLDLLHKSRVCRLVAIFSPEHGIRGTMDSKIPSSVDKATGLPIHSLYGDTYRPSAQALRGLDALVFDIQDIGARFYTYITTMAYCMEEAAKAGIPIYILDRPNPINGMSVEGPMLDADKTSFTGYMPLPVRHGMTVGELARYFNTENGIGADLRVIEMTGWERSYYFYDTGQLWVDPSPNIRNVQGAILYPGVCLLEYTNVSVGRGTGRPFELVGAPWIEPLPLAEDLNARGVAGVRFVPVFFVPEAGPHQGQKCGGVNLILTSAEAFNSVLAGMTLISALYKLYPEKFEIDRVMILLGNERAFRSLRAGETAAAVLQAAGEEMQEFLARRQKALLYGRAMPSEGGRE